MFQVIGNFQVFFSGTLTNFIYSYQLNLNNKFSFYKHTYNSYQINLYLILKISTLMTHSEDKPI